MGAFFWWRSRRGRLQGLPGSNENGFSLEENIPLTQSGDSYEPPDDQHRLREPKGKERATELSPKEEIFRVEDSDEKESDRVRDGISGSQMYPRWRSLRLLTIGVKRGRFDGP